MGAKIVIFFSTFAAVPIEKHISLSELLADVKKVVSESFPLGVWISAEISELKVNSSGHCYMELIEKGSSDGVPKASASAIAWRTQWNMIESYFRSMTGVSIAAGMNVLIKVSVNFHEAYGLSLILSDIDPVFTIGEQEQQRRRTIAELTADGVMELNRSLPIARVPWRIAVVSSAGAAGYRDFCRHLVASPYRFRLTLFEAIVQGAAAEESIIGALERIAGQADEFDAVALIRGGGAQSDLGCFNSYALCSNIAQFPLPVLTGIGHDKDTSVADMVSFKELKTPTAVADFLVDAAAEIENRLDEAYRAVTDAAAEKLSSDRERMERYSAMLAGGMSAMVRSLELRLERYGLLLRHSAADLLSSARNTLRGAEIAVAGNNPDRILAKGFAVVRRSGRAITDASALKSGEEVEITLHKGKTKAKIE